VPSQGKADKYFGGYVFMVRKWLKRAALTLIVMPEPVTTVLGILLLAIVLLLPKQAGLKKFGDLEALIKRSIQRQEKARPVFRHYLKEGPSVPNLQHESWFDNRSMSEKVLHHALKTSFPQYEAETANEQNSAAKTDWRDSEPSVVHHTLKLNLITAASGSLN
jgi:hypothetical protein